jgi:toxin-antitoxin system PIN domain toxin
MMLLDVNVLVAAFRTELPQHADTHAWLNALVRDGQPFGMADGILSGFVRIVTRSPLNPITPIGVALDFAAALRDTPNCRIVAPNPAQWAVFDRVCRATRSHGRAAQDVYWASFALDLDCEFVTFDNGFSRIPGLRWRHPLERRARTNPA